MMSSRVASWGRLTVLEMAPERNGWAAAIILMWPEGWMERVPLLGLKLQSKTARCSSLMPGLPSMVLVELMELTMESTWGLVYPSLNRAVGTVFLTIFIIPPPTSFLYL